MIALLRFWPAAALALALACAPAPSAPAAAPAPEAPDRPPATAPLDVRLDAIFADTAFDHAIFGVVVRTLDGERTVYRRNGERLLMPASNMKVVTAAAALEALGPRYRYATHVAAAGPVRDGVLQGDLVVRGAGDPTLSERFHEEPLAVLEAWADSLQARGVSTVAGDLVGVTEGFDDAPYGGGWAWDYLQRAYAAGIGALTLEESTVQLELRPGARAGLPPVVLVTPENAAVRVRVEATTEPPDAETTIDAVHDPTGALVVVGEMPVGADPIRRSYAVARPNHFFVETLHRVLTSRGITVRGVPRVAPLLSEVAADPAALTPLFTHLSPPLDSIIPEFTVPSQNQMAELVFRTLGREHRELGSVRRSAAVADSVLAERGYAAEDLIMADGSGLSRYNLVSPDLLSEILVRQAAGPGGAVWHTFFPVAGESGTLENRMQDSPLRGRVWAKTGTISNVRALSGYLETAAGDTLVFSMIGSNHRLRAADVDAVMERALEALFYEPLATGGWPLAEAHAGAHGQLQPSDYHRHDAYFPIRRLPADDDRQTAASLGACPPPAAFPSCP